MNVSIHKRVVITIPASDMLVPIAVDDDWIVVARVRRPEQRIVIETFVGIDYAESATQAAGTAPYEHRLPRPSTSEDSYEYRAALARQPLAFLPPFPWG